MEKIEVLNSIKKTFKGLPPDIAENIKDNRVKLVENIGVLSSLKDKSLDKLSSLLERKYHYFDLGRGDSLKPEELDKEINKELEKEV
jgi:hypothetical protein